MRFLSPLAYRPCGNQKYKTASRSVFGNNMSADAYRIDLGGTLSLVVADNAGQEDFRPVSATPGDVKSFEQTLAILDTTPTTRQLWFVSHRPIWYDLLAAASQPNALQSVLRKGLSDKLKLAFGGHQHAFETIDFAPDADLADHPKGRPGQIIVGGGGTQLEALDPDSSLYEGTIGPRSKERARPDGRVYDGIAAASGLLLNRYSFLLLERDSEGWRGTVWTRTVGRLPTAESTTARKNLPATFLAASEGPAAGEWFKPGARAGLGVISHHQRPLGQDIHDGSRGATIFGVEIGIPFVE